MNMIRITMLAALFSVLLSGCETLNLKLKGGSNSNVDWAIGLKF